MSKKPKWDVRVTRGINADAKCIVYWKGFESKKVALMKAAQVRRKRNAFWSAVWVDRTDLPCRRPMGSMTKTARR